jgi:hypothetical protein
MLDLSRQQKTGEHVPAGCMWTPALGRRRAMRRYCL